MRHADRSLVTHYSSVHGWRRQAAFVNGHAGDVELCCAHLGKAGRKFARQPQVVHAHAPPPPLIFRLACFSSMASDASILLTTTCVSWESTLH